MTQPLPLPAPAPSRPGVRPPVRAGLRPGTGVSPRVLLAGALAVAGPLGAAVRPAVAQSRVGTTAGVFLTLGVGARASALGHAATASTEGADALFWNPAGASTSASGGPLGSLAVSHEERFAGIRQNTLGLVVPVTTAGVLGVSVVSLDYGRMDVTTESQPEGTGETFAPSDLAVGLSYAQPLTDRFAIGGTVKYVRQRIRDMRAQTAAFDLGFLLRTNYLGGARLAASISNFGGKMRYEGVNGRVFVDPDPTNSGNNGNVPAQLQFDAWDLPLSFRLGAAVPVYRSANAELLAMGDVQQSNDFGLNGDVGMQARYRFGSVALAARTGYRDLGPARTASDGHLTYGGGLELALSRLRLGLDVAVLPHAYLGTSQMLDLRLSF